MFELSSFVKNDYSKNPIGNTDEFQRNMIHGNRDLSPNYAEICNSIYGNTVFLNDGVHYKLNAYPLSDHALEELLYVQSFSYQEMGPHFFTIRENTRSFQIVLTYEGKAALTYDGNTYTLGPGDGFFIDCRKKSSYHTVGNIWKHCVLHFYGKNAEYLYNLYSRSGSPFFHHSPDGHLQELLERVAHYLHRPSPYRDMDVSNSLENVVMYLIRSTHDYRFTGSDIPERLHMLADHIYANYAENLSLDDLSEISGYNKYYLCRIFKKYFQMSPGDYILQLRILRARELLRDTEMSVQNIGDIVGIKDTNYFYRIYKARTGISPALYRKKIKEADHETSEKNSP
ncbi:MAG: helix-turn-helix transcriptional regulator [Lachnospiraceae bacterium]|nr:helix-turn-helix transcriptional regulator [Lachnospiraceae bacterium]